MYLKKKKKNMKSKRGISEYKIQIRGAIVSSVETPASKTKQC